MRCGLAIALLAAALQFGTALATGRAGPLWAIAALPLFAAFGLAIPNVLGPALRNYGDCLGAAGAMFGLTYYSLLGVAMAATSMLPFDTPIPLSVFWIVLAALLLAVQRTPGKRQKRTR